METIRAIDFTKDKSFHLTWFVYSDAELERRKGYSEHLCVGSLRACNLSYNQIRKQKCYTLDGVYIMFYAGQDGSLTEVVMKLATMGVKLDYIYLEKPEDYSRRSQEINRHLRTIDCHKEDLEKAIGLLEQPRYQVVHICNMRAIKKYEKFKDIPYMVMDTVIATKDIKAAFWSYNDASDYARKLNEK